MADYIKLGERYKVSLIEIKVEVPIEDGISTTYLKRTINLTLKDIKKIMRLGDNEQALYELFEKEILKIPNGKQIEDREEIIDELASIILDKFSEYMEKEQTPLQ